MTLTIQSKVLKNLKSKFYYDQLLDLLLPLLVTFAISIVFVYFIGSRRDMVLSGRDQSIIAVGLSISFLFIGYVIKSIELLLKSVQNIVINEELQNIQVNRKSFDLQTVNITYKPVEYRPIKLFHIFASDTDLVRISFKDSSKKEVIDIEKSYFDELSKTFDVVKNAELKNISKPFSLISTAASLFFIIGCAILTIFAFVYFLVR